MSKTVFNLKKRQYLYEPMFLGSDLNVARYDVQKHKIFEDLTETHLSYFWRPQEISLTLDRLHFQKLSPAEKHIFTSNLAYQIVLDSVQGRAPTMTFLPLVSSTELEEFIAIWAAMEVVHSKSYTHIIRSVYDDPALIFDQIMDNKAIMERAASVSEYYDKLMLLTSQWEREKHSPKSKTDLKEALFMALIVVNALEALRFHVCFACSFAFSENHTMEGSAKIMRFIARDEALHTTATTTILNFMLQGKDGDTEMTEIAQKSIHNIQAIYEAVAKQEKAWASYICSEGNMPGINSKLLSQYVDYLMSKNLALLGVSDEPTNLTNPLPWVDNYLNNDNVQYAPQEVEVASYLTGQVNSDLEENEFADLIL